MPLTRRLILQKARRHPARLRRLTSVRFQVLFHSPPGVLFTIPSRYSPLSVTKKYLGLPGGPGRFTRDSTSPALLGNTTNTTTCMSSYTTLTLFGPLSHTVHLHTHHNAYPRQKVKQAAPTTPHTQRPPTSPRAWFSLLRFRSPLLTEYLLLRVLRCFISPRSPHHPIHTVFK